MTDLTPVQIFLLFFAGACVMTIIAFLVWLLVSLVLTMFINRKKRKAPFKKMKVWEEDGVEILDEEEN